MQQLQKISRRVLGGTRDRQARLLFAGSVVLCAAAAIMLLVALKIEHGSDRAPAHPASAFGQRVSVSMGDVTTRISKVSFSSGQHAFIAPQGQHYAVVTVSIRNNAQHPIHVLPSSDIYAKDSAGHVTYLTPYELSDPFHAGELLPGESVVGELSYLVPATGSVRLYMDAIWSGSVVPFTLQ